MSNDNYIRFSCLKKNSKYIFKFIFKENISLYIVYTILYVIIIKRMYNFIHTHL